MLSKKFFSLAAISAIIFTYLFLGGIEAKAAVQKEYYSNGKIKVAAKYKNNKLNGQYKTYYEDGRLKSISFYKDDVLNGSYEEYYPNKQIKVSANYINGKLDGDVFYYDKNKNWSRTVYYEDGKKNGYEHFYEDGRIIKSESYTNDILDGKCFFYDEYQRLIMVKDFQNGIYTSKEEYIFDKNPESTYPLYEKHYNSSNLLDGTSYSYYENSDLVFSSTSYKNNKKEGESNIYLKDGKKIHTEIFTNNILQGSVLYDYHPTGELKSINRYNSKGQTHGKQENFHPNGNHEFSVTFINGKIADGRANLYNENGKIERSEEYKSGKIIRTTDYKYHSNGNIAYKRYTVLNNYVTKKDYYANGKLEADCYLNYKTKQGKVLLYYPTGIISSEHNMFDNKENGICTTYWENGEIAYQDKYTNGKKIQRKAYNRYGKLLWTQNY